MKRLETPEADSVGGGLDPRFSEYQQLPDLPPADPVIDHNPTPQPQ